MEEIDRVERVVQQTKAIRWWIDKQITDGKSNEQIEKELPIAAAFITSKIGLEELLKFKEEE